MAISEHTCAIAPAPFEVQTGTTVFIDDVGTTTHATLRTVMLGEDHAAVRHPHLGVIVGGDAVTLDVSTLAVSDSMLCCERLDNPGEYRLVWWPRGWMRADFVRIQEAVIGVVIAVSPIGKRERVVARKDRNRPSFLSRRLTALGKPRFVPSSFTVWSSDQRPEPHLCFHVVWDGVAPESEEVRSFTDYSILVLLTQDLRPGDLALVSTIGGADLQLVIVNDDKSWADACNGSALPADGLAVVGAVSCERASM